MHVFFTLTHTSKQGILLSSGVTFLAFWATQMISSPDATAVLSLINACTRCYPSILNVSNTTPIHKDTSINVISFVFIHLHNPIPFQITFGYQTDCSTMLCSLIACYTTNYVLQNQLHLPKFRSANQADQITRQ